MRILLVDDDDMSRSVMNQVITGILGHSIVECADAVEALQVLETERFPLVITDLRMPVVSGLELLQTIKENPEWSKTEVVMITGYADVDVAIEALRQGAADMLRKPIQATELLEVINRLTRNSTLATSSAGQETISSFTETNDTNEVVNVPSIEVEGGYRLGLFTPNYRALAEMAQRYHDDRTLPVLIEGETGTGKELFARLIHSGREEQKSNAPFVPVNCAAISDQLFEAEMFGHAGGSFTGAAKAGNPGFLEVADGGTVFLDEIGEIPMQIQAKLLRFLEDHKVMRIGDRSGKQVDVRVVAATNRSLSDMVQEGSFRRDLFYRLNVARLDLPALRHEKNAIAPMAQMFLSEIAKSKGRTFKRVSDDAATILQKHSWPGNIRELRNTINQALTLFDNELLQPEHLSGLHGTRQGSTTSGRRIRYPVPLELPPDKLDLDALNLEIVREALAMFDGNKSRTARYLGLSLSALRSRLTKL
ncbi:sigma-54 dependent transcriptional regulator [bacterium]|nr:sigma-54 dependent transcriptional regulator [bacterium]